MASQPGEDILTDGDGGDDTVDISALTSAHRIVFRSNGGNDTIIGTLRPQDVIELPDGATIPLAQTASTVQLGQVLDSLRADTRKRLQELVQGYGGAVGGSPTPGEDADQDPEVQGLTAGEALNRSLVDAPEALRGSGAAAALVDAMVADARKSGFRIVPLCSYVAARYARHPDWADAFTTAAGERPQGENPRRTWPSRAHS